MCAPDHPEAPPETGPRRHAAAARVEPGRSAQTFGTIVIIGGGCYGSYYLRQLARGRAAGAIEWRSLIVVDRDPACRVATDTAGSECELVVATWTEFLSHFLGRAAGDPESAAGDAIVPSPLMPHLLFEWLLARARSRHPMRDVGVRPLSTPPAVPWDRPSADGSTHYVSFATWMCPINCIEPLRCPATKGTRHWTMPAALGAHVAAERASGHVLEGPFVFHCTHRAYGVGMIDVGDVLLADRRMSELADKGAADFLVGTVSHCHGALGVLSISG